MKQPFDRRASRAIFAALALVATVLTGAFIELLATHSGSSAQQAAAARPAMLAQR
ncbi:MAG: hypothetical protein ACM3O5_03375 [Betaproteobacteria bacterium]